MVKSYLYNGKCSCIDFQAHGEAMGRGMVLVMSLWDDHDANMLWLDSNYPLDKVNLGEIKKNMNICKIETSMASYETL